VINLVRISNFRALKKVEVKLRPLTVLVGPNDSGKTSFMDAIFLRLRHPKNDAWKPSDFWRQTVKPEVHTMRDANTTWEGSAEIFRLPSQGIPMGSKGVADQPQKGAPLLDTTGENLAAFLDYLLRKERRRFDQIQESLRQLVPGFEEIRISHPSPEQRAIALSIEKSLEIPGTSLSTGVRMLLFFVALAHHPNPPEVALIEEPENGVHPKRLKDIVELLRRLTKGELGGKPVQVILSTHSPYLLDHVRLPEDQVIVFERQEDGRRTAQEADQARLKTFLDEFMLGEVWFNQGEKGLVPAGQ